jgi:hypothetical protein
MPIDPPIIINKFKTLINESIDIVNDPFIKILKEI